MHIYSTVLHILSRNVKIVRYNVSSNVMWRTTHPTWAHIQQDSMSSDEQEKKSRRVERRRQAMFQVSKHEQSTSSNVAGSLRLSEAVRRSAKFLINRPPFRHVHQVFSIPYYRRHQFNSTKPTQKVRTNFHQIFWIYFLSEFFLNLYTKNALALYI